MKVETSLLEAPPTPNLGFLELGPNDSMIFDTLALRYSDSLEHLAEEISEPLTQSATWLDTVAKWTCAQSGQSSCDWYHGTWQYLRLLDLVSTPPWHASFFRKAMAEQSTDRTELRVLISGCADYSMYALAHSQLSDSGMVTALDLCATPLMGISWYARHIGVPVPELLVANAIEHERPGFYDMIVSDSFLPRFPTNDLKKLLAVWYESLSPKGAVLTTVRLHQVGSNSKAQAAQRIDRWHQVATDARSWWPEVSDLRHDELIHRISVFMANQERNNFLDTSTLYKLFSEAGFERSTLTTQNHRNRAFAHIAAYRGPIQHP